MSNIQQNLNQMLTTTSIMARLSPGYENKVEARNILGRAKSAAAGLEATRQGLYEKNKQFSGIQLKDIEDRTRDLNRAIYDAKIRGKAGDPLERYIKKGLEDLPGQNQLANTLSSIESRLETLRGQQTGLAERKEILRDPEAAIQKRILQMKNASARNENREKAIAGIVPKGGVMPQTEIENTNVPVKEPELPVENAPTEEPVTEETIVEGKTEMPKEEEGEEEDMYMSDEEKEFWEKRYKPIRNALDSKDFRKNIDSVLKEFNLDRESFFNDDTMQRAAYDLYHKPIRRVVADAEYTLKKNPGADRDAVFDSDVYKPILERAIEQESQPYRTPKPIYTEEEKAEAEALEKEHYDLNSRYRSTGITKKEYERLKNIESELAILRTKNNVGTSSYIKGTYTDAAKNILGSLEDIRQRYLEYVEKNGLKTDEEKEFYEKVKENPEVFYEEYIKETKFPENKKKIAGVDKTHHRTLSGNLKNYFDLVLDPEGGGFLESPDKEYREELYNKLKGGK